MTTPQRTQALDGGRVGACSAGSRVRRRRGRRGRPAHQRVTHGALTGYRTLLAYHPASGTTLVFFANRDDIPLPTLIAPLSDLFEELGLT